VKQEWKSPPSNGAAGSHCFNKVHVEDACVSNGASGMQSVVEATTSSASMVIRKSSKPVAKDSNDPRTRQSGLFGPSSGGGGGGIFANADLMKEKVRESLHKPVHTTSDYYKKEGLFQLIARSQSFDTATLCVIGFNAVWIAVDTDNNKAAMILDADIIFQVVEHLFCFYFTAEWLIRFMSFQEKRMGFKDAWFSFDSALVGTMVLETWVMTSIVAMFSSGTGAGLGNASILRIARLLRLTRMARMARLLRAIPELVILVKGMAASMRSVITTLFLLFIIMYVFGIAFAQLTAGSAVGDEYFATVPTSMYTLLLYGVMSLDWANEISGGLSDMNPIAPFVYFLFVLLATYTVMNMLIGVLCEVVSAVAAAEKEQMQVSFAREKLGGILDELDEDGNGKISQDEFAGLLNNREACIALHSLGVDVIGLVDFADVIFEHTDDEEQETELTFPEFMDIVLQLRGSANATVRDIVELRKLLRAIEQKTNQVFISLKKL